MKTELNDRTLWYDGTNQVKPDKVPDLFALGVSQDKIVVTELNEDIELFNQLSDSPIEIEKDSNTPFDLSWNIPDEFQKLDLNSFLQERMRECGKDSDEYQLRVKNELAHIRAYEIEPLIRTLAYIVSKLRKEEKIWGVGRGSSCASLVLHLIGVHEVDPIKYNIPLSEFFHD